MNLGSMAVASMAGVCCRGIDWHLGLGSVRVCDRLAWVRESLAHSPSLVLLVKSTNPECPTGETYHCSFHCFPHRGRQFVYPTSIAIRCVCIVKKTMAVHTVITIVQGVCVG